MAWVDTHCHLYMSDEATDTLLDRATSAGVEWVVCPGVDLESSLEACRIAAEHPTRVTWSAGVHPHEASSWPETEERIRVLADSAAAVGECGLDYYRNLSPPGAQRGAFAGQLGIAADLGKPAIVHCRDAFADVYSALAEAALGGRAVLHCWTGGPRWTRRFADLGVTFSFAGPVAFANGDTVRRGAAEAPPQASMVETDTPYLTPPPRRPAANEPANVPLVGRALADVWRMPVEEVAEMTAATAARVFGRPA